MNTEIHFREYKRRVQEGEIMIDDPNGRDLLMRQVTQRPQAFSLGSIVPLAQGPRPEGRRALLADNYGFGVRVDRVVDQTPASRVKVLGDVNGVETARVASLTPGDTISTVNGVKIRNVADFLRVLDATPPGELLRIEGGDGGTNLKSTYRAEVRLDD